eukprot:5671879-Karenia_brevis.AAC.1
MKASIASSEKKVAKAGNKKPAASTAMKEIVRSSTEEEKDIDLEDWMTNKSRKRQQIEDPPIQTKAKGKKSKKSCSSKSHDQERDCTGTSEMEGVDGKTIDASKIGKRGNA